MPRRLLHGAALLLALGSLSGCGRLPRLPSEPGTAVAPDSFHVRFDTSEGSFTVASSRAWSPRAVDRFYELVRRGYYDQVRFYRVIEDFVAQFGYAADPAVTESWESRTLPDEPVRLGNTRGTVSFARGGANSRAAQLFINLRDNTPLDRMGPFTPDGPIGFPAIGRVIEGMEVVDSLYSGYGEGWPEGRGPAQDSTGLQGNAYLMRAFPELDYIETARVVEAWR